MSVTSQVQECALIIEECSRQYKTGKPIYQYADAYILMLNTGIRLGEAIGLKKTDWNKGESTLHIQRNIQSISKRDNGGNRVQGKQLVANTTKTYSGDRIIPLNKAATEAIQRLCEQHPDAECIICSSKGDMIPPERLERTFYRILKNVGISQAGLHSLRHPYVKHTTKKYSCKSRNPKPSNILRWSGIPAFSITEGADSQSNRSWTLYAISMRLSGKI